MRVVFAGTPDFAVPSLRALAGSRHEVLLAVTQPDRGTGRGRRLMAPAVKRAAEGVGVPLAQTADVNGEGERARLAELRPDVIAVVAFGQMLGRGVLAIPTHGCVNVHGSLLPRWRGAAPIAYALFRGDAETGVTTQRMVRKMDAGDILLQARTPIGESETAGDLHDRLAGIGADLLVRTLDGLEDGSITPEPQDPSAVTFAPTLAKHDGAIDWTQPAEVLRNRIRGLTPWPSAFTFLRRGEDSIRLVLLASEVADAAGATSPGEILEASGDRLVVATGLDALRLTRLQRAGKKPIDAAAFLRGLPIHPGEALAPTA